jgi:hypothetical protein
MNSENVLNEYFESNPNTVIDIRKLLKSLQRTENKPELVNDLPNSIIKDHLLENHKDNVKSLVKLVQKKLSELEKSYPEVNTAKTVETEIRDKIMSFLFVNNNFDLTEKITIVESTKKFVQLYDPVKFTDLSEDRKPLAELIKSLNSKDLIVKVLMKEESRLRNELNPPAKEVSEKKEPVCTKPQTFIFIEYLAGEKISDSEILSICLTDLIENKTYFLSRPDCKSIQLLFSQMDSYGLEHEFINDTMENEIVNVTFNYKMYLEKRLKFVCENKAKEITFGKIEDINEILKSKRSVAANACTLLRRNLEKVGPCSMQMEANTSLDLLAIITKT